MPKIDPAGHEFDAACAMARKDANTARTKVVKSMVIESVKIYIYTKQTNVRQMAGPEDSQGNEWFKESECEG